MKKNHCLHILGISLLQLNAAFACDSNLVQGRSFNTQSILTRTSGCVVRVSSQPTSRNDSTGRVYSFSTSGMFQVYNAYGSGRPSAATGARVFYLFPRHQEPAFSVDRNGVVTVTNASGNRIQFSNDSRRIQSIEGFGFTENPQIRSNNNGGVEIQPSQQLVLDTGYQRGGVAYSNPSRNSVFYNSQSEPCPVPNREIFIYTSRQEPRFRFTNDAALHTFLSARCPSLDLSSLQSRPRPQPQPVAPMPAPLPPRITPPDIDAGLAPHYPPVDASTDDATAVGADAEPSTAPHTAEGVESIGRGGRALTPEESMDAGRDIDASTP